MYLVRTKCNSCSRSGLLSVSDVRFLLLQAFEARQVQAATPVDAASSIKVAVSPSPPPPLKTAGIKWGAADADADVDTEADAAVVNPAAEPPQPPLQIAGIKWGAVAQPETAPSQVWSRPVTAS